MGQYNIEGSSYDIMLTLFNLYPGSESQQCGQDGQCRCKPGVTGDKCDRCAADFYDFGNYGCRYVTQITAEFTPLDYVHPVNRQF